MKNGGKFIIKIPDQKILEKHLKEGPISIPVQNAFLYDHQGEVGHSLVINGMTKNEYIVNDPGRKRLRGDEYKIAKKILLYAWVANNRDSNGYLLVIRPKK